MVVCHDQSVERVAAWHFAGTAVAGAGAAAGAVWLVQTTADVR